MKDIVSIWIGLIVLSVVVTWAINFVFTALQEIKEDLNEHKKRIESLYTLYKNQEEQKKIEDEQI